MLEAQFITAPDGSELVVITRDEYDRLRGGGAGVDDARDIAAATAARADPARYPADVVDAILAGDSPIAAWRKHRGLSQAALAQRSGITQAAISRLERTGEEHAQPLGRRITRKAIAAALNVPVSALDPLED